MQVKGWVVVSHVKGWVFLSHANSWVVLSHGTGWVVLLHGKDLVVLSNVKGWVVLRTILSLTWEDNHPEIFHAVIFATHICLLENEGHLTLKLQCLHTYSSS